MTNTLEELYRIIAMLQQEPPSREMSLAITNAQQALLWYKYAEQLRREKEMGPASGG